MLPFYHPGSIDGVKVSISISAQDVALLDAYARTSGLPSRSAAVQRAIALLRHVDLEQNYLDAWTEWESSGENVAWEAAVGDGIGDATR